MKIRLNCVSVAVAAGLLMSACTSIVRPPESDDGKGPAGSLAATLVANQGFERPLDVVPSPDSNVLYFTGFTSDEAHQPALFRVPAAGGEVRVVHAGAPFVCPTGIAISCDGSRVYVADMGRSEHEDAQAGIVGAIHVWSEGEGLRELPVEGLGVPNGLAADPDCQTLYVSGRSEAMEPGVFSVPLQGGRVTAVHVGAPLVGNTGLTVGEGGRIWVLDHLSGSDASFSSLFELKAGSEPRVLASRLRVGSPAGIILGQDGTSLVVATRDQAGHGQLTFVSLGGTQDSRVALPALTDPAGMHTTPSHSMTALVDSEGNAIYRLN